MRKLLFLMLVLGVASMANATLQISVNGVQEPIDSEIIIPVEEVPSGILTLDIWTDADVGVFEQLTWALVVTDNSIGTISGGVGLPPLNGAVWAGDAVDNAAIVLDPPYSGKAGTYLAGMSGNPLAGDTMYDDFLFHCEGIGDATVELWSMVNSVPLPGEAYVLTTLLDTVTIHQVPEPMTMALLGLGGLFLRRRK